MIVFVAMTDELYSRIIWLGDLNYRVDAPDEYTWELVNQGAWECLLQKDQVLTISTKASSCKSLCQLALIPVLSLQLPCLAARHIVSMTHSLTFETVHCLGFG